MLARLKLLPQLCGRGMVHIVFIVMRDKCAGIYKYHLLTVEDFINVFARSFGAAAPANWLYLGEFVLFLYFRPEFFHGKRYCCAEPQPAGDRGCFKFLECLWIDIPDCYLYSHCDRTI